VPKQDPKKIIAAFEKTLRERCPVGVTLDIHIHGGGGSPAFLTPLTGKPIQLAAKAIEAGFGKAPVFMREGGSIPIVGKFKEILGIDTLLIGFGLPDDRVHSPNEKFELHALQAGTRTAAALYQALSEL
jgi:acetylornithine deacetylase/succinyl-diaminopimelate desuccinylase-like protein